MIAFVIIIMMASTRITKKSRGRLRLKAITIRGVDEQLAEVVKSRASQNGQSVNQWLLHSMRTVVGLEKEPIMKRYDDLDFLAGGWTAKEAAAFAEDVQHFEKIDRELWD